MSNPASSDSTTKPALAAAPSPSRTVRVVSNSFWLGLDNALALLGGLAASILVARHFGPALLGVYAFISALVLLTGSLTGGSGMVLVVRKLVAESIARRDYAATKHILRRANFLQALIASTAVALGLLLSVCLVERQYWTVAFLAVLSLFPNLMLAVATGANGAVEDFRAIVTASILSCLVNLVGVGLTVWYNGGLKYLALSLFASRLMDWLARDAYRRRNYRRLLSSSESTPDATRGLDIDSIGSLLGHTVLIQVLSLLVLDRSELFALKYFNPVEQVAFFSISFGLTRQVDLVGRVINQAAATAVIRRNAEDPQAAAEITHSLVRITGLIVLPILAAVAALSRPLVSLAYGARYLEAIPVLTVMAATGWAGSLTQPLRAYVLARGQQIVMVQAMLLAAGANLVLALSLVPRYGALGAAWSNGLTQLLALGVTTFLISRRLAFHIRWQDLARIGAAAGAMALVVAGATSRLPPAPALCVGAPLGSGIYVLLLRILKAVPAADRTRLDTALGSLPGPARRLGVRILEFVAR